LAVINDDIRSSTWAQQCMSQAHGLIWEVGRIALASAATLNVHQALCKSACFESRRGHHYRETCPGSSLSSRRAPRQTCPGRGANLRPPGDQADALTKELSRQLISWLFGASTWPSPMTTFSPLQAPGFFLPELWLVQPDIVDIVGNDELLGFCLPELWLVQPDIVDIVGNDELLCSHLIVKVPEILAVQDPRPELNEGLHVGQQAVQ
jgi:hypothetical protein